MTCTIEYSDDAELLAKCRAIISRLTRFEPMPVKDLALLVGRSNAKGSVSRSLHRKGCPPFEHERRPDGTIKWLRPNAELLAFLTET